jgi:myo-inositol 2-dehydrogenase / D-chiro-inositol 1-dehydrogenase
LLYLPNKQTADCRFYPHLEGSFAEKGSHFFDFARWLTNAEPVSLFTMGAVLVDPGYAEIGEYDTAVIAMHLGNGVPYRFDFS